MPQRYLGTYFFCFRPLIDQRQLRVRRSRKTSSTNVGIGRTPGAKLRRFIQPLPQSLDPPDELGLVDRKVIFLRACNLSQVKKLIAVR